MSDDRPNPKSDPTLRPDFAKPAKKPAKSARKIRKRGRGLSIRFLLTITIFVAIAFAIVREFRNHLELLVGLTICFSISVAIGMAFVAVRRKAALQEAFLALLAASRRVGLPVAEGAKAFARQCGSRGYRRRLVRFSGEVANGIPVPDAVMSVRGLIPRENGASFRAIEATSGSEKAYARLMEVRNATIEALDPLVNLISYYLVLAMQFVILTAFLIEYVQPKFVAILGDFGMTQQPSTASAILDFLRDRLILSSFGWRVALMILVPLSFVYLVILSRGGKGLGFLGAFVPFLTTGERAMVLRGLAESFRTNTPVEETMRIFADWSLRGLLRRRCRLARQAMISGVDWVDALAGEGLLLRNEVPLARAAVRSGNVGNTLENLADSIQSRQWYRWRLLADVANPVLTILFSFMVLLVCWTFFVPLVNLIQRLAT